LPEIAPISKGSPILPSRHHIPLGGQRGNELMLV